MNIAALEWVAGCGQYLPLFVVDAQTRARLRALDVSLELVRRVVLCAFVSSQSCSSLSRTHWAGILHAPSLQRPLFCPVSPWGRTPRASQD